MGPADEEDDAVGADVRVTMEDKALRFCTFTGGAESLECCTCVSFAGKVALCDGSAGEDTIGGVLAASSNGPLEATSGLPRGLGFTFIKAPWAGNCWGAEILFDTCCGGPVNHGVDVAAGLGGDVARAEPTLTGDAVLADPTPGIATLK